VVLSALLGAAAGVAVTTHPFTDEGDRGPHLLGNNHQGPPQRHRQDPGGRGEHARPGWDRGDKDGWHGRDVPPGWWKHDDHHPGDRHPGDHQPGDHQPGKPDKNREHDR
jgi:hypothetical protein